MLNESDFDGILSLKIEEYEESITSISHNIKKKLSEPQKLDFMSQAWEEDYRKGSLSELRHAITSMLTNLSDDQISEIAGVDVKIRQGPG